MPADYCSKVRAAQRRIQSIQARLPRFDLVASGTVTRSLKKCGRATCKCAQDPAGLHGPYYQWSRREEGHQVNGVVTPDQAKSLEKAIRNRRQIVELLKQWERESKCILDLDRPKVERNRAARAPKPR